jgi:arginyl-tRNA synthetase
MNSMNFLRDELYTALTAALHDIAPDVITEALPAIHLETPRQVEHGDIATNIAMLVAKQIQKNPRLVAEAVVARIPAHPFIASVEIAGAGFINVRFTPAYYHAVLVELDEEGSSVGRNTVGEGQTVNVEYVSANPTGLLHVGHGRNAAVGDCVANLYEWNGYSVTREYYFNNAGNQMNTLALCVHARYCQIVHDSNYPFPEDGYGGEYIVEIAQNLAQEYGTRLIEYTDTTKEICRKAGEEWCFDAIKRTMKEMRIYHQVYFNEDSLYSSGKVLQTIEALRAKEMVYEHDGATWLALSKMGLEKDRVIVKSTGEPTYRLPDIAYHVEKLSRGYDVVVDVFGADHIATIPDVMAACKALGYETEKIRVLIYQFLTVVKDGEIVKASKRLGTGYALDDLIDDVGVDVARFFFIMRGTNTHLEFDINLAKEQSEKNPVFYLQYAHARIAGILRHAKEQGVRLSADMNYAPLTHVSELSLIKELESFHGVIHRAALAGEPQMIAEYLRGVAVAFHKFYHDCRILGEEKSLSIARLGLARVAKRVVKNGLQILGVSAPDTM